ncbi:FAD-dependent oxidoreductase [Bacillus testis]|uniref:FAD-dependent oxidoreductase n=1 Tax=Bacillus testis TaxID=1622072 RepID=UPI00067F53C1|nr:FAD-dependent oxidoreductase [Bacillus testis]
MDQFKLEPDKPESYWLESSKRPHTEKKVELADADVIIAGAGITGITLAYLLVKAGVRVILFDAGRVMNGTTGHTTAKVTAQHGLIYDRLLNEAGREKAQMYYQANAEALSFIRSQIKQQQISCDYSVQDAYVFTNDDDYLSKLEREYKAYQTLGIHGSLTANIPIGLDVKSAIAMEGQAQFHPVKYLNYFVSEIIKEGGTILEQTPAVDVETGNLIQVKLRDGNVLKGKQLVMATHFPFYDKKGFYFARLEPQRSYVIGARSKTEYAGGMYISAEKPKRSIRATPLDNGDQLLLIGGDGHKTGQGIEEARHYNALLQYAKETFKIDKAEYRWSAQDLKTLDGIPYIGHQTSGESNLFIATGYDKWGMTNGTAGALLLRDLILGKESEYQQLYNPSRFDINPSLGNVISFNADVAKQLIKGKLDRPDQTVEELAAGEGGTVVIDGKRAGAYRDEMGQLHMVDTTCTHLGCEVKWNSGDKSWDCPCHGSRFSYQGEVLEGPATKPLKRLDEKR